MKVLVLTAMYPSPEHPASGTFVEESVLSLRKAGVEVDVMAFEGARSFRNYIRAGTSLRRHLRTRDYDVIHGHYGLVGLPARMQFKCPIVLTYHGSDILGEVGPDGRYTFAGRLKVFLSKALGFMVDERTIVADALRTGLWSADLIPMGVDMELFRPMDRAQARERLGLDPLRKYVMFVANPDNKRKRFELASAAVNRIAAEDPVVEICPVFKVNHDLVPVYMNAGNALVLTSDHEASPCVIKEAMACNLPIASVDVGDVRERITGVDGCFLCDRTVEDVAAKLKLALAHEGPTGGRAAVEPLSMESTALQTIAVFERAAHKHRRRPKAR